MSAIALRIRAVVATVTFVLVALLAATTAFAHTVSVGYRATGAGTVTIYYGSYHTSAELAGAEGTVTINRQGGGYSATQPNTATYTSRPAGLTTGTNYHFASGYGDSDVFIWQSATFTGVPSGTYSIALTGSFSVVWEPVDASISSPSSTFNIDASPPIILGIPTNITVYTPSNSATAVATWTPPTATDDAGIASFTTNHAPGSSFPVGVTTVTYTAIDTGGNSTVGSFTVTVIDNVPPVISGTPSNVAINASPSGPTTSHAWTPPTASDNVGVASFTLSLAPGGGRPPTLSSYAFPIGTTTLTYSANDAAGNGPVVTSFQVTVTDTTPPVIASCPMNQTLEGTGPGGAVATWSAPTATDNSGNATLNGSHASGATFPIGNTTVTYTATDAASNSAPACSFVITVVDTTPPVLGAASNITVTATDLSGANVAFALPTATDVVDTSVTVSANPASGTLFAIGAHTVTVTAVDDHNNQASRTFTVTVLSPAQIAVTPGTDFIASGPQGQQGGSFGPTSQTYTVTNSGQVPMNFTVTGAPSWATISPRSGTVPAGGSMTVVVALNSAADALAVGNYTSPISFTNVTNGIGNTTRNATLNVLAPAALTVTPAGDYLATGPQGQQGGAFTPASATYTLNNSGAFPLSYSVTAQQAWLTVSPSSGTIPSGGSVTVTFALNSAADSLPVGQHSGVLAFTNQTNGLGNTTRNAVLTVNEPARMTVTPADGLVASGYQGGPFSPSTKVFTVSNSGANPMSFSAADDQGWLDVSPATGVIPGGGSITVTLAVNASANGLGSGTHSGTLTLTNTTNGLGNTTRPAAITVIPNGTVILKVVTTEGDGTFSFSSSAAPLGVAVATAGGVGQSAGIILNPGTYGVTVTPPNGFGLTKVSCSELDSSGDVASKSATIILASTETVTCTFESANSLKKTVEVIGKFLGRRNDRLLTNGPDTGRQVDRLLEFDAQNKSGQGAGGSSDTANQNAPGQQRVSRLGAIDEPRFGSVGQAGGSRAMAGGRSIEDRRSSLGMPVRPDDSDPATSRDRVPGAVPDFGPEGSTAGQQRLAFSTSLSQVARQNAEAKDKKVRELLPEGERSGLGLSPLVESRPKPALLDVWMQGYLENYSDNRGKMDADGHFGVFYLGADYILNRNLLVGALVQFDSMRDSSRTDAYEIKGTGWMAGPYATIRLSENLFLQGRAAWGNSSNEVRPFLTYSDHFDTTRWLASSALVGRWKIGGIEVRPSATLSYIEDVSESYVDKLGVTIPGIKVSLGQLKAGPMFSYRFGDADRGWLEPRFGLEAIWNFESSGPFADFGETLMGPEEVRGRVEIGLKSQLPNGLSLDVSGSYDGVGSDTFHSVGGRATLRIPLQRD